jgi:hypothetical protein
MGNGGYFRSQGWAKWVSLSACIGLGYLWFELGWVWIERLHNPPLLRWCWGTDMLLWLLVPVGAAAVTAVLFYRDAHRPNPGHCHSCGYDLTGNLSGRCPECGTPVAEGPKGDSGSSGPAG